MWRGLIVLALFSALSVSTVAKAQDRTFGDFDCVAYTRNPNTDPDEDDQGHQVGEPVAPSSDSDDEDDDETDK